MDGRTDGHLRPTLLGRLGGVDLKMRWDGTFTGLFLLFHPLAHVGKPSTFIPFLQGQQHQPVTLSRLYICAALDKNFSSDITSQSLSGI